MRENMHAHRVSTARHHLQAGSESVRNNQSARANTPKSDLFLFMGKRAQGGGRYAVAGASF